MSVYVSVLVCTHNGAGRLPETIRHLAAQEADEIEWELLIIDNASTDETAAVARRECEKHADRIDYRLLYEPQAGKGNALERGFGQARGRYLVVCDDDTWLAPDYLSLAVEVMDEHPEVGVLSGWGEAVVSGPEPDWFAEYKGGLGLGRLGFPSGDVTEEVGGFGGAGSVLRRSAIDALWRAGYSFINPARGQDWELCKALRLAGWRFWYEERLRFRHEVEPQLLRWEDFLRRVAISGRNTPCWHAFDEVIEGKFTPTQVPSRLYWLRKVVPGVLNGHLAKVLLGLAKRKLRGNTRNDRYRSLVYQFNVWLGYVQMRGRFVDLIRRAIRIQEESTNRH